MKCCFHRVFYAKLMICPINPIHSYLLVFFYRFNFYWFESITVIHPNVTGLITFVYIKLIEQTSLLWSFIPSLLVSQNIHMYLYKQEGYVVKLCFLLVKIIWNSCGNRKFQYMDNTKIGIKRGKSYWKNEEAQINT